MIIQCPKCGEKVVVNGLGRRRLDIPVKNVYDALLTSGNVSAAARSLGCSRGYIYKVLKANGVKVTDVEDISTGPPLLNNARGNQGQLPSYGEFPGAAL
jgi:hypothetical protein